MVLACQYSELSRSLARSLLTPLAIIFYFLYGCFTHCLVSEGSLVLSGGGRGWVMTKEG